VKLLDEEQGKLMLDSMEKLISQIARPANQAAYQSGLMDGTRYYGDGHAELMDRYKDGSSDYRLGFDAASQSPRAIDPDFAT